MDDSVEGSSGLSSVRLGERSGRGSGEGGGSGTPVAGIPCRARCPSAVFIV